MISDYLNPEMGHEGLRWAMSLGLVTSSIAAYLLWRGSAYLINDLARAPR